ncbi:Anucleate primary sterigmata protein B [Varicellaria rhodocarpa]|nr:Anucleate primary sterigmata protein B [Varicellaria rhodocarpa]
MTATLTRHYSGSAVDELERRRDERDNGPSSSAAAAAAQAVIASQPIEPSQQRWVHRLKELERRLKAEREARLLDQSGARKRLEEVGRREGGKRGIEKGVREGEGAEERGLNGVWQTRMGLW